MQKNYFDNTSLGGLKTKFLKLTKDVINDEEKQTIAISIILDRYKELHSKLNTIRKASNLPKITLDNIETIATIKTKFQKLISGITETISNLESELDILVKDKEEADKKQFDIDLDAKSIKIYINDQKFDVELAITEEEHITGLSNRPSLKENRGMLFVYDEPQEVSFWMEDTLIPLDIIFINEDLEVISVYQGKPNSTELMTEDNVSLVLELNVNSGIKQGDELNFEPKNKKENTSKMLVLNSDGDVQMELDGGERIFSRAHTKTLIKFSKKAATTNVDNDYRALGKRMFKFLQVQSDTAPEYVQSKTN